MKRSFCLFLIFCFVFSFFMGGCAEEVSEETNTDQVVSQTNEGQEEQTDVTEEEQTDVTQDSNETVSLPKTSVDFSVTADHLIFGESDNPNRGYVRPGHKLTLSARVYKTASSAGGGWIEFLIDGEPVDRVPFFMEAGDEFVKVETHYILPFTQYLYLNEDEETPIHLEARILADGISEDTTDSDNVASLDTIVKGVDLEPNEQTADVVIESLKTTSDLGENIAVPGKVMTIRATLRGGGGKQSWVRVYVDEQMLYNKNIFTWHSGASMALNGLSYYVPWNASGTLKIRIELENGRQAKLEIPVASYDYIVRNEGISWELPSNTAAGNSVSITCRVEKDSGIPFARSECSRVILVVNGIPSEPIEVKGMSMLPPYTSEVVYHYKIPEDCIWPLEVKAIADPGELFGEKDENNNIAGTTIPISAGGVDGPELSVSAENLWYYPSAFEPGDDVELFAAVYNGSSSPASGMRVKFFVDGVQLDPANDRHSRMIRGGQYIIFHETWTVPDGLTSEPVFTVEVVSGNTQTEGDLTNNSASMALKIVHPDIFVDDVYIYSGNDGGKLVSEHEVQGFATVHNTGAVSASSVNVEFYINGTAVGSKAVDLPPFGSMEISVPFTLPAVTDETPVSDTIAGLSGHVTQEPGVGTAELTVKADPQNTITESDEDNNSVDPITLQINTAPIQGSIYVKTWEITDVTLPGVTVQMTSNGKTASAVTDSGGACTFKYVPFGPYELTADKSGFNTVKSCDEVLYEGDWCNYASMYLDDYSYINGRITASGGSGLSDVMIEFTGAGLWTRTNSNGEYSIKVPAGSYRVKYTKTGYGRRFENITISKAQTVTRDFTMSTTNLAYMIGWVYDEAGEPFPGMSVEALNASGQVTSSVTTDSEGYYELEVPISAPTVSDVRTRVSGHGYSKELIWELSQGVESRCDFSFQPVSNNTTTGGGEIFSSISGKVTPWVVYNKVPGTIFTEEIEVEAIYGAFDVEAYMLVENSVINDVFFETTPGYWYTGRVEGSWNPAKAIVGDIYNEGVGELAGYIFPWNIPIVGRTYSSNRTQVIIKKITIVSDGQEVCEPLYPDETGSYDFSPEVAVNWDNCRIKFYLYIGPDDGAASAIAGYRCDRVLIEWDPKAKTFTRIGYYTIRQDPNTGNYIYMDQG